MTFSATTASAAATTAMVHHHHHHHQRQAFALFISLLVFSTSLVACRGWNNTGTVTSLSQNLRNAQASAQYGRDLILINDSFAFASGGNNDVIYSIELAPSVSVKWVAGYFGFGLHSDNANGKSGRIADPAAMALDVTNSRLLIPESKHSIRTLDIASPHALGTLACQPDSSGDTDGTFANCQLSNPQTLSPKKIYTTTETVYLTDYANDKIRNFTVAGDYVGTLFGVKSSSSVVAGHFTDARLRSPQHMVKHDRSNSLFISDFAAKYVVRADLTTQFVSIVLGTGSESYFWSVSGTYKGTNDPLAAGVVAQTMTIRDCAIFLGDSAERLLVFDLDTNSLSVVAGDPSSHLSNGDVDGSGEVVRFNLPYPSDVDSTGTVYIMDQHRIKTMTIPTATDQPSFGAPMCYTRTRTPTYYPGAPTPDPVTPSPDTPSPPTPAPDTPSPATPGPNTPAPATPVPDTPAPVTPAPNTPTPDTPSPATPGPDTPAPDTPAPNTPAPNTPAPDTPTPATPAPDTPSPATPTPGTPSPATPGPNTPSPDTPSPATPGPNTPSPNTPTPDTPSPNTPAPNTPSPATPAPDTPAPNTPAPNTPSPATPAPNTPAPNTPAPAPGSPAPDTPSPITPSPSTPAPGTPSPNTPSPPGSTANPSTPTPATPSPATPTPSTGSAATTSPNTPSPPTTAATTTGASTATPSTTSTPTGTTMAPPSTTTPAATTASPASSNISNSNMTTATTAASTSVAPGATTTTTGGGGPLPPPTPTTTASPSTSPTSSTTPVPTDVFNGGSLAPGVIDDNVGAAPLLATTLAAAFLVVFLL